MSRIDDSYLFLIDSAPLKSQGSLSFLLREAQVITPVTYKCPLVVVKNLFKKTGEWLFPCLRNPPVIVATCLSGEILNLINRYGLQTVYQDSDPVKIENNPKEISDFSIRTSPSPSEAAWYRVDAKRIRNEIAQTLALLKLIHVLKQEDPDIRLAMTGQVLAKILSSRRLVEGMEVEIPTVNANGDPVLTSYIVNKRFDLWKGVPAYGLVDKTGEASPIILFRSTSFSPSGESSLASLTSNFHPKGPAWNIFATSRSQLKEWLLEHNHEGENPARLLGYSQGGAIVQYLAAYEPDLISKSSYSPSMTFDAPGISKEVVDTFNHLPVKPNLKVFINKGDIVPKLGFKIFGDVYEIDTFKNLSITESHSNLSLLEPSWAIYKVDNAKENKSSFRSAVSMMQQNCLPSVYSCALNCLMPCLGSISKVIL